MMIAYDFARPEATSDFSHRAASIEKAGEIAGLYAPNLSLGLRRSLLRLALDIGVLARWENSAYAVW